MTTTACHRCTAPGPTRCDRVLLFSCFATNLGAGRLPRVAFVASDLRDDMRSGPVRAADGWLRRVVGELEA